MKVGVQSFRGARLKEARLARGFYMNSLADLIGVSKTAISRYEEDIDKPQEARLEALAKHLNFPVEFFTKPESQPHFDIVFWRSRAAETKYARQMTEQRMTWLCEIFELLEREVDFPVCEMPPLNIPQDFRLLTGAHIESAAEQLRRQWRLWDLPIPDVALALENVGIPVVMMDLESEKQDGFCFRSPTLDRVFVGINTHNISPVRARFDAAHELGHAVLHRNVTAQQSRDPTLFKVIEQQAHRFAASFIFPQKAFVAEVRQPSLDYFSSLKKRWGLSIGAMIYRAFDLGMIDEEERGALYRNMGRRGWRGVRAEPFDKPGEMPLERPRMLRRAVEVITAEGVMSKSAFQAALALPALELERLTSMDPGFFNTAEIFELAVRRREIRAVDLESGRVVEFPRKENR